MVYYIREDDKLTDFIGTLLALFARAWLVMLALGGIGHQMNKPVLYLPYWTVWLACFALRSVFNQGTTRSYKVSDNKKEAERGWY